MNAVGFSNSPPLSGRRSRLMILPCSSASLIVFEHSFQATPGMTRTLALILKIRGASSGSARTSPRCVSLGFSSPQADASVFQRIDTSAAGSVLFEDYTHWENYMTEMNNQAPNEFNGFHTSAAWVTMNFERQAIFGTAIGFIISVLCAFIAILLFTGT